MVSRVYCSLFGVALFLCVAVLYSCTSDIGTPEDALKKIGEEEAAKAGDSSSSDGVGDLSSSSSYSSEGGSSSSSDDDELSSSSSEPCDGEDDCEEPSSSSDGEGEPSSSSDGGEPSSSSDGGEPSSSSEELPSSSSEEPSSSSSTPNPVIGDCVLPIYTCVGETIEASSLVSIENNIGCSSVISLSGSGSTPPSLTFATTHKGNRNISVIVTCSGVSTTKTCKQTFVADCVVFDHNDKPHYPLSTGSTVIKLEMNDKPNGFGCERTKPQPPRIAFSVTTPNGKETSSLNSDPNYNWEPVTLSGYEKSDNRILFETSVPDLECTTWK